MKLSELEQFLKDCIKAGIPFPKNTMNVVIEDFYEVVPSEKQNLTDLEFNVKVDQELARVIISPKNSTTETQLNGVLIKATLLAEYNSYTEWEKPQSIWIKKYGVNRKILTVDCNNMLTTGYDLKNAMYNVFPVKVYLAERSVEQPLPYKSIANN